MSASRQRKAKRRWKTAGPATSNELPEICCEGSSTEAPSPLCWLLRIAFFTASCLPSASFWHRPGPGQEQPCGDVAAQGAQRCVPPAFPPLPLPAASKPAVRMGNSLRSSFPLHQVGNETQRDLQPQALQIHTTLPRKNQSVSGVSTPKSPRRTQRGIYDPVKTDSFQCCTESLRELFCMISATLTDLCRTHRWESHKLKPFML